MASDEEVRAARAREVGLFRYALIRPLADPELTAKQRGVLVRAIAAAEHQGPGGQRVRVSRATLDRWARRWRQDGFDALVPAPRVVQRRTPKQVTDLAVAVKKETPARTAAQVRAILIANGTVCPSERTLQRLFVAEGLSGPGAGTPVEVFGRFEAPEANHRWTGDALHGPAIKGSKAILFAFIDDHTRVLTGYRWVRREDTIRVQAALRYGVAARGIPQSCYVDNGPAYVDAQFHRALAVLGIKVIHSQPNRPQGKAKIERFFRTVRDQFLVEIGTGGSIETMAELNRLFTAWVETVYHQRVHTQTGQTPLARWADSWARQAGDGGLSGPRPASGELLREAFLWSAFRTVTKTATVSLEGNHYEVDPSLCGRRIELVFDPFAMDDITVRWNGHDMGKAVPHILRAHVHRKARPDETSTPPVATGIDYLAVVADRHDQTLGPKIAYSKPPASPGTNVPKDEPADQYTIDDYLNPNGTESAA
jgi:putative transposase